MQPRHAIATTLVAVTFLLAAALSCWFTRVTPRIDKKTYDQIRQGMKLAELEAIIGVPPGDYAREGDRRIGVHYAVKLDGKKYRVVKWSGHSHIVYVQLDDQDCVVGSMLDEVSRDRTWLEGLLGWLGLG